MTDGRRIRRYFMTGIIPLQQPLNQLVLAGVAKRPPYNHTAPPNRPSCDPAQARRPSIRRRRRRRLTNLSSRVRTALQTHSPLTEAASATEAELIVRWRDEAGAARQAPSTQQLIEQSPADLSTVLHCGRTTVGTAGRIQKLQPGP